jgi:hypothetical protein
MSTIAKAYELFINGKLPGGRNALLKSKTDGNAISEKPIWMQGDKCLIHLYFREPGAPGSNSSSLSLDESFSMVLSGSLQASPATPLFSVSAWTKQGEADVYYEGTLNLGTIPLDAAFAQDSTATELQIPVDIEVRDFGNTIRITYRANISISRQMYAGEAAPGAVALPAALLTSPDGSTWQLGVSDVGEPTFTKVAE